MNIADTASTDTAQSAWPSNAVVLALAVVATIGASTFWGSHPLEDAFITFRYARHFAEGYGYGAWNRDGSFVDGSTSFLWTAWIALGFKVGLAPIQSAILGTLALSAALIACLLLSGRHSIGVLNERAACYAIAVIVCYLPAQWYLTTGMESVAFMALAGLVFVLPVTDESTNRSVYPLAAIAAVLMRPEGILVVLGGAVCALFAAGRDGWIVGRRIAPAALLAVVATVGLMWFRHIYFGAWFPNTYYAKAAGLSTRRIFLGAQYLWYFTQAHQVWLVTVLIAVFSRPQDVKSSAQLRWLIGLVLFAAVYGSYVVDAGGDEFSAFPFWRHAIHILPVLAIALALAISIVVPRRLGAVVLAFEIALSTGILLTIGPPMNGGRNFRSASFTAHDAKDSTQTYFAWVQNLSDSSTTIATSLAGKFPYAVDAVFIDMLGLNDVHIAHQGTTDPEGPVDSKTDGSYVLSKRPDIIEGYLPASALVAGDIAGIYRGRPKMIHELVDSPVFQQNYCFAKNAPYKSLDRALFIRRDFATAHRMDDSACVPVEATILAAASIRAADSHLVAR